MVPRRSPYRGLRVEPLEDRVLLSADAAMPAPPAAWSALRTAWLNHLPAFPFAHLADPALPALSWNGETQGLRLYFHERQALWENRFEHGRHEGSVLRSLLTLAGPTGKELVLPPGPELPTEKGADGGALTAPALPPGSGAGVAMPGGVVSMPPTAGTERDGLQGRSPLDRDALALGPPAAEAGPGPEAEFSAEPGPPVAGLLPFDLKSLREGVDALFERLGALARPADRDSLFVALGPWLLVAGVLTWELTLLLPDKEERRGSDDHPT